MLMLDIAIKTNIIIQLSRIECTLYKNNLKNK